MVKALDLSSNGQMSAWVRTPPALQEFFCYVVCKLYFVCLLYEIRLMFLLIFIFCFIYFFKTFTNVIFILYGF